jgi:hypothetical protein
MNGWRIMLGDLQFPSTVAEGVVVYIKKLSSLGFIALGHLKRFFNIIFF